MAAFGTDASAIASAAAAEQRVLPQGTQARAKEEGCEAPGPPAASAAPLDRLEAQAVQRWRQLQADAQEILAGLGLVYRCPRMDLQHSEQAV